MRKYMFVLLITCALALSVTQGADASLMRMTVEGDEVIVDGVNDLMWADLQLFISMTYAEQQAEIEHLNDISYAGSSDWSMSTTAPWDETGVTPLEVASQFAPTQPGLDITWYIGRVDVLAPEYTDWHLIPNLRVDGYGNFTADSTTIMADDGYSPSIGAWVSAPLGEPQPTPEPATMFLFGTGLIALAGFRRKLKE